MAQYPLIIEVALVEKTMESGWWIDGAGRLKVHFKGSEHDADDFLVETFAETLHIPRSHVEIINGKGKRFKRVKIGSNVTLDQLIDALDIKKVEK